MAWPCAKSERANSPAKGLSGLPTVGNRAANGYGANSSGAFGFGGVLVLAAIVTAFFVYVVLGTTNDDAPKCFAPLAIGLALTAAYLVAIQVSNGSVNPARSTAVAFFNGAGAPGQLWAFWLAPIVGGLIAGATFYGITGEDKSDLDINGRPMTCATRSSILRASRCSNPKAGSPARP
jgi:aquaporin Z